jgi:hypothetical protein
MFEFTAYGKNFTVQLNTIFSSEYGIKCTYEHEGEEAYLFESNFYESQTKTKESTDAVFKKAIEEINKELQKTFGKVTSAEPDNGIKRIEWLIKTNLKVVDNNLQGRD